MDSKKRGREKWYLCTLLPYNHNKNEDEKDYAWKVKTADQFMVTNP